MGTKLLSLVIALTCAVLATVPLAAQSASPAGLVTRTSAVTLGSFAFPPTETAPETQRAPRAPYVILGLLAGATVGGILAAHRSAHCTDWCLPGLVIAGGAVVGGASGALLGLLIHDVAYPKQ